MAAAVMPHMPFARHAQDSLDGTEEEMIAVDPPALLTSPQKLSRRHSLLNSLRTRWRKHLDPAESIPQLSLSEEEQPVEEKRLSLGRRSSNPELVPKGSRRVIPSLPRPQTFRRGESEKREKLLEVPSHEWERESTDGRRTRGWSLGAPRRPRSPKPVPLPSCSAPEVNAHGQHVNAGVLGGLQQGNGCVDKETLSRDLPESPPQALDDHAFCDKDEIEVQDDEDEIDQASLKEEYDRRWILNLSMSFRDKSQREKFFVTFAETPTKWRRITISLDYRTAPEGSLEADVKSLHYQRDKSFRIFEAIRESLADIQYYDTVTNLKLETTEDDGQLHVHVREDANEIIQYPAASLMDHVSCQPYRESELEFDSHLSGFVYKVRVDGYLLIKKEIPGPDTVDEFLYEVNALDSLCGCEHVVQLQGLITDESGHVVKGLLISYAARGALVDMIYDYAGELPWHRREKWARQIVSGLSAIHEAGFVQGDFTLSNIVIDDNDDAQIIDINRRGCPVGWEPPELGRLIDSGQRIGMHISVKTDLYQLGMVLWALAEEADEPERARPLPPLRSEIPRYFRHIVETCLDPRPQGRSSASRLLRDFPRDAGRPPVERPSVDFCFSPNRTTDHLKASDPSVSTTHRSDKEYIDPDLAVTLDEVRRRNRDDAGPATFTDDQVTYVDPLDSHPASNTSYHFESSGSWIVGRSRGRSPGSSRRRRSSPFGRSVTSVTRLSLSPDGRSGRSVKVYLHDEEDEAEERTRYPSHLDPKDLSTASPTGSTSRTSRSPVFVDKRIVNVQEQETHRVICPPLHQDSGFDEQMLQELHLEDTIVPQDDQLQSDPRIYMESPQRYAVDEKKLPVVEAFESYAITPAAAVDTRESNECAEKMCEQTHESHEAARDMTETPS